MSRKKPITIKVQGEYKVLPGDAFKSEVIPSGNGAVIKAFKRYIGKECIVIIMGTKKKKTNKEKLEQDMESASPEGWQS